MIQLNLKPFYFALLLIVAAVSLSFAGCKRSPEVKDHDQVLCDYHVNMDGHKAYVTTSLTKKSEVIEAVTLGEYCMKQSNVQAHDYSVDIHRDRIRDIDTAVFYDGRTCLGWVLMDTTSEIGKWIRADLKNQ